MSEGDRQYDLTTLADFQLGMRAAADRSSYGVDGIHCPKCGQRRRVDIRVVSLTGLLQSNGTIRANPWGPDPTSVIELSCRQCHTRATALVYPGPSGPDLVILWSHLGGLRTPHTPDGVAYYLDQASRAESVGARSAAVTMYRAAVEQLLLQQGYKAKMLGPKLVQLDEAIAAGSAPKWATDLAKEFMDVLRELGNAATHAGDGDVSKQDEFDTAVLVDIRVVIERLLKTVYEQPGKDAALLARLTSKAGRVK